VEDGATLAGHGPQDDPSLADDQTEFTRLSRDLFGDGTGVHKVGTGVVYAGQNLDDVFHALDLKPDFDYTKAGADTHLLFVHRKLEAGDIGICVAGDKHYLQNAGMTPATYFVVALGPPE